MEKPSTPSSVDLANQRREVPDRFVDRVADGRWVAANQRGTTMTTINAIDGHSNIDGKVDGQSNVTIIAGGMVTIGDKVDGQTTIAWKGAGFVAKGGINGNAVVKEL
jgi:hypothetical protein